MRIISKCNPENKQLATSHEVPDYIEEVANYYDEKFANCDSLTRTGS